SDIGTRAPSLEPPSRNAPPYLPSVVQLAPPSSDAMLPCADESTLVVPLLSPSGNAATGLTRSSPNAKAPHRNMTTHVHINTRLAAIPSPSSKRPRHAWKGNELAGWRRVLARTRCRHRAKLQVSRLAGREAREVPALEPGAGWCWI